MSTVFHLLPTSTAHYIYLYILNRDGYFLSSRRSDRQSSLDGSIIDLSKVLFFYRSSVQSDELLQLVLDSGGLSFSTYTQATRDSSLAETSECQKETS